jgi:putative adhesin
MSTAVAPAPVARTPRGLRIALAVVVVALAAAAILHGAWTLVDVASRHTFDRHAAFPGVRAVRVGDDVGTVRLVRARAGAPVSVLTHTTEGLVTPSARAVRSGRSLTLSASCPTAFAQECHVDYTIALPAGTQVRVDFARGDLKISGYARRKPLALSTGGGDIELSGVTVPSLTLDSSAGDIKASGVRAPVVDARSSAGDVSLELAAPPRRVTARSSAGDVELRVPDVPYRVHASSSGGDVRDGGIRQDPHAPRSIDASSSAGDVTIEPAG